MTATTEVFKQKTHLVQLVEELGGAPYNEDSDAYYLRQTFEQENVGALKELENSNLNSL